MEVVKIINKVLLCLGFIIIDYITGIIKSIKNKNLNSTIMRNGLFRKSAEILLLLLSFLLDYCITLFSLDFPYIFNYVMVYILIMEATSSYENICSININLKNNNLSKIFEKINKEV